MVEFREKQDKYEMQVKKETRANRNYDFFYLKASYKITL